MELADGKHRDPIRFELLDRISKLPGVEMTPGFAASTLVVPLSFRKGDITLNMMSIVATEEAWRGLQATIPD